MTESGSRPFPPNRCPLCGSANQCARTVQAASPDNDGTCASCWCKSIEIPKELLAKVPDAAQGRACICRGCCNAAMSEPAAGVRKTVDPGGREAIQLTANGQTVLISHTGAQVLSWQIEGDDVLWTASAPEYVPGKPVRGGVPVVFPWFGDHKSEPGKPAHGFARSLDWHCSVRDERSATFSCSDTPATRAMWDHAFRAELTVTLGDALRIAMTITNTDEREFSFEQALHTYFSVGDIHQASVHGLQGVPVVEHAREPEADWDQSAPIRFRAETDRVFQQVPDELSLQAPALGRTINLCTSNSRSTIVWNPWPNKTARLTQMHGNDWRSFVCVESANAFENSVRLAPGASHEMTLTLSVVTD